MQLTELYDSLCVYALKVRKKTGKTRLSAEFPIRCGIKVAFAILNKTLKDLGHIKQSLMAEVFGFCFPKMAIC